MLVQPSLTPDIIIFLNKYWPLVKTKKPVTMMMMMLRKSVLKDISRKLFYQENCERGERGKVVNLVSVFFHQRDCIGGFAQITTLTFAAKKLQWNVHRDKCTGCAAICWWCFQKVLHRKLAKLLNAFTHRLEDKNHKNSKRFKFDFFSWCQFLRSQPNVPIRPTRRGRLTFSLFHGFRQFQNMLSEYQTEHICISTKGAMWCFISEGDWC